MLRNVSTMLLRRCCSRLRSVVVGHKWAAVAARPETRSDGSGAVLHALGAFSANGRVVLRQPAYVSLINRLRGEHVAALRRSISEMTKEIA
jgi:hypothetical protein